MMFYLRMWYVLLFLVSMFLSDLKAQNLELLKDSKDISPLMELELKKKGIYKDQLRSYQTNDKSENDTASQKNPVISKADTIKEVIQKPIQIPEVYGQDIFGSIKPYFTNEQRLKPADDYKLGEGDELRISIWGYSELDEIYRINKAGSIMPKLVGRISLKGMTYKKALSYIRGRFSRVYDLKNSQMDVQLAFSKVIQVNVTGEVNKPGTYTVAAVNSAFNILSLAEGLNNLAGVREILILRNAKVIGTLDVYDYLMHPESFKNSYLENGDFIVVKPYKNVVTVSGQVLRPNKYELKDGEGINELISFSGGLKSGAYLEAIHISRIIENKKTYKDIDYTSILKEGAAYLLINGDEILISKIEEKVYGYVDIEGAVNIPGRYELSEGADVKNLINKAEGIKFETFLDRAFLIRTKDDNTKTHLPIDLKEVLNNSGSKYNYKLKEFDRLLVFERSDFKDDYHVEIFGSVRKPMKVSYDESLSLKDVIALSGGLKVEAANSNIEISRISNFSEANNNDESTKIQTLKVAVDNDLQLSNANQTIILKPFDQIFVRSTPNFEMQQNVLIEGEVEYPGTYSLLSKNETIKDLISRAGGFTPWASLEQSTMKRDTLGSPLLLDLKALYKNNAKEYNYVLEDGDKIMITRIENTVSVSGAVEYPFNETGVINLPYKKRKRAKYFVKNYVGGFKKEAFKRKIFVQTPGGRVKKTTKPFLINKYPKVKQGDRIIIPYREQKEIDKGSKEKVDWNEVIENFTIKLTAILTVSLLLKNISAQ